MTDETLQTASDGTEDGIPGVTEVGPADTGSSSTHADGPVTSELDGPPELDEAAGRDERH